MNYKITVSYDGTSYKGWQIQKNVTNTIQGKLENILTRLMENNIPPVNQAHNSTVIGSYSSGTTAGSSPNTEVSVIGSGRTDAGVHAIGQVANFHLKPAPNMTDTQLLDYINAHLPEDIAVTSIEQVADSFHARYSATSKTYRYRIHVSTIADVFNKKYVYTYTDMQLNIGAMKQAASLLTGTHDFRSFCGNKHMKKSTIRTITDITIGEVYHNDRLFEIYIDYTGDGFLQNMIRIMTGTLIEIGSGRRKPTDITDIINAGNRETAGYTAPPQGLCLMKVEY